MFREMKRINQKLSEDECKALLKTELRGVLGIIGDEGYPYTLPINHYYDEEENALYFHSGKIGHKMDAIKKNRKASFCIYDSGYKKEGEWALNIKSVILFGKISFIEDQAVIIDKIKKLSYKFTDDDTYIEKEFASALSKTACLKFTIEHMSGKIVYEA